METKKAIGQRGSWFAKVDGTPLPCIHKYWLKGLRYHDRYRRHENASTVKIEELVDAIRSGGKVILTDDDASLNASGEVIGFDRTKYIAIYAVTAVEYDKDNGLRLNLSERLAHLE